MEFNKILSKKQQIKILEKEEKLIEKLEIKLEKTKRKGTIDELEKLKEKFIKTIFEIIECGVSVYYEVGDGDPNKKITKEGLKKLTADKVYYIYLKELFKIVKAESLKRLANE